MIEETTFLKQDFKQKENKYLADFLNMKSLKEKVEDKLVKQDQSLQTVHMLCRPRPLYNEQNKVFSVTTKSELNVARFAEMHVANTSVEARCLALEAELATLRDKSHQENQGELIKHFSKLENNRDAHLDYLRYLKESVETIRDIVKEAKVVRPLDRSIVSACRYTKHSQELLEYAIGTCPQGSLQRAKQLAHTPLIRKKQVTTTKPSNRQDSNKHKHAVTQKTQKTNVSVSHSTGVTSYPKARGSQPKSNPKTNRISPAKGANKLPIEDLPKTTKSHFRTTNHVDSSSRIKRTVVQIVLWYLDSGCSKHMTGHRLRILNFVKKFIGTVRFGNDHFGAIMGYEDYVVGESVISRVYYVKGLGHNLFSVGQFCDSDLEVAFRKNSCYVNDHFGAIMGYEDYVVGESVISRASKNKSWLWHRCLNHLNFGTINDLARKDLVRGLPRLKFEKDHLCSACQLGKSKKHTHKPKADNTNLEVLNTLHMDICGPMRVQIINGKKYILVVDDYSRFTWVKFLRSKDETPDVVIKFITQIQVGLNKTVRYVHTDNETEFVNHTMKEYYERIGIFHQKTVPRNPQQNGVVERRNHTLIEAAQIMLIFSKALMFLRAEAVATAVFGALCYPTNDNEDLGKLQPTADTGIFTNVPVPHSTRVTSYPKASGSQPKSNSKTNRISPAKDTMDDMTAPTGQAPAMAPPVHTNDQILPRIRWVQTGYLKFSAKGFGNPNTGSVTSFGTMISFTYAFSASPSDKKLES
nr:hypothetical protein [Tanacetum cinerariifolium]